VFDKNKTAIGSVADGKVVLGGMLHFLERHRGRLQVLKWVSRSW
jgi:hypothetical protein